MIVCQCGCKKTFGTSDTGDPFLVWTGLNLKVITILIQVGLSTQIVKKIRVPWDNYTAFGVDNTNSNIGAVMKCQTVNYASVQRS